MQGLIAGVVGIPLLASAVVALLRRWPQAARIVALAAVALTALCAAALAFYAPGASLTVPEWLPGAGPMDLTAGASGLYAALATSLGLLLVLLSALPESVEHPELVEGCARPDHYSLSSAVLLLALGGANAALLADHFLLRYVALEIAALCILLAPAAAKGAPVAEKPTPAADPSARGGYLLLRLGDAGLLAAIPILWRAAGTLRIDPALEAGKMLASARLGWAATGLVLAVWVKLGGWPFHTWARTGRRLSLASQAWLYATVVPNLGAYLLYRVTPLLAVAGPIQVAALWIGAIGALLAALLALMQRDPRAAMVYVGAVQGGLMLLVAAAGIKSAVWLGLLALTPLRLLLFLAADAAQKATSTISRRIATGLLVFGGLALLAFDMVIVWWARSVPATALLIAQVAVALGGAWPVAAILSDCTNSRSRAISMRTRLGNRAYGSRWATIGLLSATILAGGLAFGPLVRFAADVTHATPPPTPTLHTLTTSLPALVMAVALAITVRQLRRWPTLAALLQKTDRDTGDSEKGLARVAETLRTVIEVAILERAITWVKRAVTDSAKIVWIVEHGILEGTIDRSVQAVTDGAGIAHRAIEQEGLEGVLRRAVDAALALGRRLQRWHTGRLRRNLLWVPVALALAIVALVVYGR
jgi:formate hydrogenlyase subunit 3/multisubunit Na+/H+ antiporter MnhD subunit